MKKFEVGLKPDGVEEFYAHSVTISGKQLNFMDKDHNPVSWVHCDSWTYCKEVKPEPKIRADRLKKGDAFSGMAVDDDCGVLIGVYAIADVEPYDASSPGIKHVKLILKDSNKQVILPASLVLEDPQFGQCDEDEDDDE